APALAHSAQGRPSENRAAKGDWRRATPTFVRRISGSVAAWRRPQACREKESRAMVVTPVAYSPCLRRAAACRGFYHADGRLDENRFRCGNGPCTERAVKVAVPR